MKRFIIFSLLVISTIAAFAQISPVKITNNAFKGGERLKYVLRYGFFEGGEATISVNESVYEGKLVYHAIALGFTKGITDKIFGVRDIFESYFDKETGLAIKKIRNIKEGNYRYYNEALFDRKRNVVISQKSGEHKAPEYIHDILSVFYYVRCMDISKLKDGDAIKTVTYFGDGLFPFEIRYRGKEKIKTKWGEINCYKFVPIVEPGRIFTKEDDMSIWFSEDSNMVPIRIEFEMLIGSFICDLIDYSNVRGSLKFSK